LNLKYKNIYEAREVGIPKLPGIYKFTNLKTKKVYIGKSVNLKQRLFKINGYFQKDDFCAFRRTVDFYGWKGFSVEILELFPTRNDYICNYILEREVFWIKFYQSYKKEFGYNMVIKNDQAAFFSEESRRKMSVSAKARIRTEEEKQKLRDWYKTHDSPTKGMKFPSFGPQKQKLFGVKILQIDPKTNEIIKHWPSIREASRAYASKGSNGHISGAIKNGRIAFGFLWRRESI